MSGLGEKRHKINGNKQGNAKLLIIKIIPKLIKKGGNGSMNNKRSSSSH